MAPGEKRLLTERDAIILIQSLEPAQLETLRNELEIDIFHAESQLGFLSKAAWFVCALAAAMALLNKDVVALLVSIIVAGLAYTMKSIESRKAAYLLAATGLLVAFDVPYRLLSAERPQEMLLGYVISIVFLGVAAARIILQLEHLRAFRSLIPLPPAAHLQE